MATSGDGEINEGVEGQHDKKARITLTADELRVLKECNNESFWYRCVPLGIVFIGTSQLLVNRGFLNPNPRFGALFKNLGAGLAAFLIGKMSYQGRCREKILQLENSGLAEAIRKGKRGVELMKDMSSLQVNEGFEHRASDEATDHHRRRGMQDDGITVEHKGLDDALRPSVDRETSLYNRNEEKAGGRSGPSYDELRQQNRTEYERKLNTSKFGSSHGTVETKQPPPPSPEPSSTGTSLETESGPTRKARRNKYGDVIE